MLPVTQEEKPLLVNAGGDFSYLKTVSYKSRFLYSKYNPLRTVISVIQHTSILPGSLIIICSPCLWYGIDELQKLLPQDCCLMALEAEKPLAEVAQEAATQAGISIPLFSTADTIAIDDFLRSRTAGGSVRRAVRIDFSAGVQFNEEAYRTITAAADEIIATFWMNRITLVKMGRLFAKNIFQNAGNLAADLQLDDVARTVTKPIIVCGAGESLDTAAIPSDGSVYVMAVDAALHSLLVRNIPVDAAIALESQAVIQKAYIGTKHPLEKQQSPCTLFADITSRPSVVRNMEGHTVWFATEYTQSRFLSALKDSGIIHEYIAPLGSVGLAAVLIALRLRADESVPVYVTGLDFSYSMGKTHAKGAPAHTAHLSRSGRMNPAGQYDAAFAPGCFSVTDKRGKPMVTSRIMQSYAECFAKQFSNMHNLFDIGKSGIPLGIPYKDNFLLQATCTGSTAGTAKTGARHADGQNERCVAFYIREKEALLKIRNLLTFGDESKERDRSMTLREQLEQLLCAREYLYLHFPDGYRLSLEPSFLKRVRAEIDFFLKQIEIGQPHTAR